MRLSPDDTAIRSEFADDPDMGAIVHLFVTELPQRIAAVQAALSANEWERLRTLAHQLKGAAGGYGFPQLGAAAGTIDQGIKDGCDVNVIRSRVGTFCALASRVRP
jgi:HPt (histidine-containing phosphotransfer) domain-containing protein